MPATGEMVIGGLSPLNRVGNSISKRPGASRVAFPAPAHRAAASASGRMASLASHDDRHSSALTEVSGSGRCTKFSSG